MQKKYIYVHGTCLRDEADNWLLMIPEKKLSSQARIVYLCLKKIQRKDFSCMTDAHSWEKISGLPFDEVKKCLTELERFDLIEQYYSTKALAYDKKKRTFCVYLLYHPLMKNNYIKYECPHDGDSFPDPQNADNVLEVSRVAVTIKEFKQQQEELRDDNTPPN
jgi:hypothetical protein